MRSLWMTLAMYTKLPAVKVPWDSGSMKYVFLWFPLIGVFIGVLIFAWFKLAVFYGISPVLFAAIAAVLPLLITGGIHMDGFMDTSDAIGSYGDREKRLAIMKDPHVGAFGVIACCVYLLFQFALWTQLFLTPKFLMTALFGFVISRTLAGFTVVAFTPAKDTGLARTFSDGAGKKPVIAGIIVYLIILCAGILFFDTVTGGTAVILSALLLFWYKKMTSKNFGGISGDLTGYLMQCTELLTLAVSVAGGVIWSL